MPYIVRAGDNLSTIGARLGVNWRQMTGFRSGNPNLIYPGEVITWPGDTGGQPQQAAAAPTPAAPAGPTVAEQQAAIDEGKYNQAITDFGTLQNDWKYLLNPGDVEGEAMMKKYLDTMANNPYLDPYYAERISQGIADPYSNENTLQSMLADPEMTKRFGKKWLEALALSAGVGNDNTYNDQSMQRARQYLDTVTQVENQGMTVMDETANKMAENNIRGGARNKAMTQASDAAAGNTNKANTAEADWRKSYIAGNRAGMTGYAQNYRNNQSKVDWANIWGKTGVSSPDLKNKFMTNAQSNWTT